MTTLTIVFDNYAFKPELTTLWGFAAVIQLPHLNLLFDTGSHGRVLLKNMQALNLDPTKLDMLFLSHPHWDHIGGLDSILEVNPDIQLVLHEGFSKHLIQDLHSLCGEVIIVGTNPQTLASGVYSTGMLHSDPPEQAMVIESGDSTLVISGCAHPGMEQIVAHVKTHLGKNIDLAVGGFHLMYANAAQIEASIKKLRHLGVKQVIPTHCTGDQAITAFRQAYGNGYIEGGVGQVLAVSH